MQPQGWRWLQGGPGGFARPAQPRSHLRWTFPPRLWDAYVLYKDRSSKGAVEAFAVSRNGSFGTGQNSFPNMAAHSALAQCSRMSEKKADGINSPCFLVAAEKDAKPYVLTDLVLQKMNELNWQVAGKAPAQDIPPLPKLPPRAFSPEGFGPEVRIDQQFPVKTGGAVAALAAWKAAPAVIDNSLVTLTHAQAGTRRAASFAKGLRAFAYGPDGASAYGVGKTIEDAMAQVLGFCTERRGPDSHSDPVMTCRVGQSGTERLQSSRRRAMTWA